MKSIHFASCALTLSIPLCIQAQQPTGFAHLQQIATAASLSREGLRPWHLKVSFTLNDLNGKRQEDGTIEEWWTSPKDRRLVIVSPSYNDPALPDSPKPQGRARYLVDELVSQIVSPVPEFRDPDKLSVVESTREFGKTKLTCISVSTGPSPNASSLPRELCVEPGTSVLRIHFDSGDSTATRNNVGTFQGVEIALDNKIAYSGKLAIAGHIDTLETFHPAQDDTHATTDPPAAPPPARIAGGVLAGKIVHKVQPVYPVSAKEGHVTGTVLLRALITKQGTIGNLEVIASPDPSLSTAALDAVKQWIYTPYLLNGSPTDVDTTITVNFNMSSSVTRF